MLDDSLTRITEPEAEPITTAEGKKQCQVIASDDDDYIDTLIATARELVEHDSQRSLMPQSWRKQLHAFPDQRYITLPMGPVTAIEEFSYIDADGDPQTVYVASYTLDTDREPAAIFLKEDYDWPDAAAEPNAVTIEYSTGYADAATVPARAKHAIKLLVGHWYRFRDEIGRVGDRVAVAYDALIESLTRKRYP
jgi:uncharacterized phiE125 gp8 family phage protein